MRTIGLVLFIILQCDAVLAVVEVKLGALMPLTGDFAHYGNEIRRGVEVAVDELIEQGMDVEVLYEDACLPEQAVRAFSSLSSRSTIQGIVGGYCVIGAAGVVNVAKAHRIPVVHSTVLPDEMLSSNDMLFSAAPKLSEIAQALARYASNELSGKKIGILHLENQWGEAYARSFRLAAVASGVSIVHLSSQQLVAERDFRTVLMRAKSSGAELLFVAHIGPQLGILIRQARQIGYTGDILLTDEGILPSVRENAGPAFHGVHLADIQPLGESYERFGNRYRQAYGEAPVPNSWYAYTGARSAALAIERCGDQKECVISALQNARPSEVLVSVHKVAE